MKVEIKESGAFDGEGKELAIGTVLTIKADELPGWLVGKAAVISGTPAKDAKAVTNPAGDDTQAGGAA